MNDLEAQAHELLRHREWVMALELFNTLLNQPFVKNVPKERIVVYLLGRSECFLELGRHEAVVSDCRKIIKLIDGVNGHTGARAWRRLVHALFTLQRFNEAEAAAAEWIASMGGISNPEALKLLEHARVVLNGKRQPRIEEELFRTEINEWNGPTLEEMKRKRNHPVKLIENDEPQQQQIEVNNMMRRAEKESRPLSCIYCGLSFISRSELKSHCQSESHQTVIMSDEGRDWKWRPPPRGHIADNYTLCDSWFELGTCRYGAQCVEAHGPEELIEWRERFEYRRMKLQRACEKELYGKSYTELLLDRWSQTSEPNEVMREKIDGLEDSCSSQLVTTMSSKASRHSWTFTFKWNQPLRAVALLQDTHRNHFFLSRISTRLGDETLMDVGLSSEQEWTTTGDLDDACCCGADETLEHTVQVGFCTEIYGTFRQSVVFDFGLPPALVKHLCVDVMPVTDADKMRELKKELVLSSTERWNSNNSTIVRFRSSGINGERSKSEEEREAELVAAYPAPSPDSFTLTQATVTGKRPTRNNYRARMHELLFVEEMARYELVANYNIQARLQISKNYLLSPSGIAASTAKYAHNGELFAMLNLGKNVSEDTSAGRLILNNCATVFISPSRVGEYAEKKDCEEKDKRVVYEAIIEDKGKNVVYLRLSAQTVQALNLKPEARILFDVQFQLNRVPYCEWHQAIDKISDFRLIFPETYVEPTIPWSPQRQWSGSVDSRLNPKQREAVMAITAPLEVQLPPILIIGPFGTGKTYTLAQAIKEVLKQPGTRVLVCTHSNSAADLYIKDYLHPYVEAGHEEARPLRIFYHRRWVATVNNIVQKYAMFEMNDMSMRTFKIPKVEDILKHRVIVVTLNISMHLSTMGLRKGHFTHILLDEAAQAMECEAIMPLALANDSTRIVLAGDHMQLSPELFSEFAKERNLHISLLERLYDHYPSTFPCKILLCENYRAHEAIIQFTSELFYEQKLISSGKQPRHDYFYPLTFFTTRGEDVQDHNSTAFYNNSEVYEVVERVCELKKRWPASWGKLDEQSIGIMTPYSDQVFRIRSELRKRRLGGISVERVLNVQGKQFRAIFLSTVRTRRTCSEGKGTSDVDFGFLSNSKLLNTAITRAQSLVAVVGDPVALCSVGRCRKVWERFIEICNKNDSLFGIKWSCLRSQLDGVELKRVYTLNPLAPEFIPRQYREPRYFMKPMMSAYPLVRYPAPHSHQFQIQPPQVVPYPLYYPAAAAAFIPAFRPVYPSHQYVQYPLVVKNSGTGRDSPPPQQIQVATPQQLQVASPQQIQVATPIPSHQTMTTHFRQTPQFSPPQQVPPPVTLQSPPPVTSAPPPPPPQTLAAVQQQLQAVTQQSPPANAYLSLIQQQTPYQLLRTQQQQQQQQMALRKDKRDIQFLHNVHFPERQSVMPILPKDVPVDELLDSQPKQLQWYNYLLSAFGFEAATKFAEFIANTPRKPVIPDLNNAFGDLYISKSAPPNLEKLMATQQQVRPSCTTGLDPGPLPIWCDQQQPPTHQLQPPHHHEDRSSAVARSIFCTDSLEPPTVVNATAQRNGSLPLYQRQPGISYAGAVKTTIQTNRIEPEEKDLLAGLRDLGNRALGIYQYFS